MRRLESDAEPSPAGTWLLRAIGLLLMLTALAVSISRAPDRPVQSLVARWAPLPSDFIELDGMVVHLRDEGPREDRHPLLLLHDIGSSLHTWDGWAAALRRERRVIRIDLPGAGLTGPRPDGDYRVEASARFVVDLLDTLKLPRVQLAGNGRGGEVAWHVAAMAPARIDRLVLANPTGLPWRAGHEPEVFTVARLPLVHWLSESLLPRDVLAATAESLYADPAKVTAERVDRSFELLLREGNRRALHEQVLLLRADAGQSKADAERRLAPLVQPVLLLWGQQDRWLPADLADRLAAHAPMATLVRLPNLGHLPQEEDPAASLAPVKAFLAS